MSEHEVSRVLEDYEQGHVTRREVVARLAGNRIYFPDPDGLEVQLAAPGHRA
jgi:hypothetical protein